MDITDCLDCNIKLEFIDQKNGKHKCPKCDDIYLKCHRCELEGKSFFDWDDNDKGCMCLHCKHHFCPGCWQNTGGFGNDLIYPPHIEEMIDGDEYLCEFCFTKQQEALRHDVTG